MRKFKVFNFFVYLLTFCLAIGIFSNIANYAGLAISLLAIFIGLISYFFNTYIEKLSFHTVNIIITISLITMIIIQLAVLKFLPVSIYHDPYRVLSQADQLAAGNFHWTTTYFWRYPNNVPITYFLYLWLNLTQTLFSTNLALWILSFLILNSFILLTLKLAWQLSKRKSLIIGLTAFFVLTPFSYTYYLQVFYTDLPNFLLLLLIFDYLFKWDSFNKSQQVITSISIFLLACIAYLLKPNIIILIPAILILWLLLLIKKQLKKQLLIPSTIIILGLTLGLTATNGIYQLSNFKENKSFEFPKTSWIAMGLNEKYRGTYASEDVTKEVKLKNEAQRQTYDKALIAARIKKLGFSGLIKLWIQKLAILLNVGDIQNWYNGGYRNAPGWYQKHAQFFAKVSIITYSASCISIFAAVIARLFRYKLNLKKYKDQILLLSILTILGYLAFHTLLWESEPRYGQVILPMLFILLTLPIKKKHHQSKQVGIIALCLAIITPIFFSYYYAKTNKNDQIIAAQRSQLSVQYHAKSSTIQSLLKQRVRLNAEANYFSVQIHKQTELKVYLKNLSTNSYYALKHKDDIFYLNRKIKAGNYEIIAVNPAPTKQAVNIIKTYNYYLAPYPLYIDGKKDFHSSFIYTFVYDYKNGNYDWLKLNKEKRFGK